MKGKDNTIVDALSHVSPWEPEAVDKDDFEAIPVHHIISEVSATEAQLERVRVAMQVSKLNDLIFQGWPDARRSIPESIHPFWNYRDELIVEVTLISKPTS